MKVRFTEIASLELADAVDYYNLQLSGLGDRFKSEVKKGIERIIEHPKAWQKQTGSTRRYIIKNFPYKIIYKISLDVIYIIAIACSHRKPDYWVDN